MNEQTYKTYVEGKGRGSVLTFLLLFLFFTLYCYTLLHVPEVTLAILNYRVIRLPSLHRKSRKRLRSKEERRVIRVSAPCVAK